MLKKGKRVYIDCWKQTYLYPIIIPAPMKHRHRLIGYGVIGLLVLIMVGGGFFVEDFAPLLSPVYFRELLLGSGLWGYVLLTLLVAASIPLPIPSSVVILAGGYIYGIITGSILSLIGIILGSCFSFYLTRFMGKPFLEKMVDAHHLAHFNHIFQRRGMSAVLISYAIPVFPSDAISLFLGITSIRFPAFFTVLLLGHIPRILLTNVLGNDLWEGFSLRTIVVLIFCLAFVLAALFRETLKKVFFKELRELEQEAKIVEREVEREVDEIEEKGGSKKKQKKKKIPKTKLRKK